MAFTGAATQKVLSGHAVRITGLSLAGGASGTIALHTADVAPDVRLPASFNPVAYENAEHHQVDLADALDLKINRAADSVNATPLTVSKAGGTGTHVTGKNFAFTVKNNDAMNATPALEIYVLFYGG